MLRLNLFLLLFGCILILVPSEAYAIPPPDLLVTFIQSVLGSLGISAAFLVATVYIYQEYAIALFRKHKKKISIISCLIFLGILIVGVYFYFTSPIWR